MASFAGTLRGGSRGRRDVRVDGASVDIPSAETADATARRRTLRRLTFDGGGREYVGEDVDARKLSGSWSFWRRNVMATGRRRPLVAAALPYGRGAGRA
jgi:hypothetical protein